MYKLFRKSTAERNLVINHLVIMFRSRVAEVVVFPFDGGVKSWGMHRQVGQFLIVVVEPHASKCIRQPPSRSFVVNGLDLLLWWSLRFHTSGSTRKVILHIHVSISVWHTRVRLDVLFVAVADDARTSRIGLKCAILKGTRRHPFSLFVNFRHLERRRVGLRSQADRSRVPRKSESFANVIYVVGHLVFIEDRKSIFVAQCSSIPLSRGRVVVKLLKW